MPTPHIDVRNGREQSIESESRWPVIPTINDINTLQWVRDLRNERIRQLSFALTSLGVSEFEILPTGSTCNGHYMGPKSRDASWAKVVPEAYDQLVEVDLRIVLPEHVELRSPLLLERLRRAIGSQSEYTQTLEWESLTEWDDKPDAIFFYRHEPLIPERKIGLEWEVGVYREPVSPVDQYWEVIFTPGEIDWQREMRRTAMVDGPAKGVDYKEHFWLLKRSQCHVGISRITAAIAIPELCKSLGADGQMVMDIFGADFERVVAARTPNMAVVREHVDNFLEGRHPYPVLQDFAHYMPKEVLALFTGDHPLMQTRPEAPRWVRFAHALHEALREGRSDLDFNALMSPSIAGFGEQPRTH